MLSSGHLHRTPKVTWESHSEDRVCIVELSSISTTCGLYYNHLRPITPSIHNWGLSFFEIPTYVKGPSPFLLNPVYKGLYVFHSMYLSPIALKTSSQGSHPNRRVICYRGVFGCDLWNRTTRGYIYQLGS